MTFHRTASLVVAAGYMVLAAFLFGGDAGAMVTCALTVLLPVPFIWFPDAFGAYTGPAHFGYINRPTPGWRSWSSAGSGLR
jgi:hypothetical protein